MFNKQESGNIQDKNPNMMLLQCSQQDCGKYYYYYERLETRGWMAFLLVGVTDGKYFILILMKPADHKNAVCSM